MKTNIVTCIGSGVLIASLLLLSNAVQACTGDPFSLMWGSDVEVHMAVRGSEACKFGFNPRGTGNHVASNVVIQPPQHGTLTPVDVTHWSYHPNPGFAGRDVLVLKATGDVMGNRHIWSGDINFTYDIDVSR